MNQVNDHLQSNSLHEINQSAYRKYHSTETALLKIVNDILCAVDSRRCIILVLLDMSAAFDTVDHSVLLNRLQGRYAVTGHALKWLRSYFTNRQQKVNINGTLSNPVLLDCGIPQGSLIGPNFYPLYVAPVFGIARQHGIAMHMYADDTQLYLDFNPSEYQTAKIRMESCIQDIRSWLQCNCLKLNDEKTEFMVIGQSHYLKQLVQPLSLTIGGVQIPATKSARNIGAIIDNELKMAKQVNNVIRMCYASLYSLSRIRKYVSDDAIKTLVHAFVTCRIDNFNSLLTGLPSFMINRLQLVQNAAARLICRKRKHDHITGSLMFLHWLPVEARIEFKILLVTFKALNNIAPSYIINLINIKQNSRALRSSAEMILIVPKTRLKTVGDRSFAFAAAKMWNSLPNNIKMSTTVDNFKSQVKTFLFKKYYM